MTDRPEHAIPCPWCKAGPGNRCTRPSGGHLSIPSHDARIAAWTTNRGATHSEGPST